MGRNGALCDKVALAAKDNMTYEVCNMGWIRGSLWSLALFVQFFIVSSAALCKETPPSNDKPASATAPAAGKNNAPEKAGTRNLRCPDNKPWTDEIVARSINVPVERLKALKAARSLSNEQVCTFPEPMLQRAWKKLETGKPGYPDAWAEFRNLQRRSDDGTVKPDGLIRGHEHRKAVLKKIAEKKSGKHGAEESPEVLSGAVGLSGTEQASIEVPASGVDINLAGIASNQWTEIGPGNIGGRIRAIAIDPANTNSIWIGGVAGGIYHSSDYGASFTPVNDFMANLAISSIIIDPSNPNIMYVGTGEGFYNADAVRGAGIFKSTDGGITWNQLASARPAASSNWYFVNRIALQPGSSSVLLAATNGGIYRSPDAGTTWSKVTSSRTLDIKFDPNNGQNAIAGGASGQIYYSTNGGTGWTTVTIGAGRVEIAYAKSQSGLVYASVNQNSGEIWKSTDGGVTWGGARIANPQHLGNQGWYANAIWVDPTDANHVIAAGLDAYRSTNGGTAWTKISNWGNNQIDIRYGSGISHTPHADHHVLVADPGYNGTTNRVLYNGNDGGLYRSPDITLAGETSGWDELNNGIALTQFFSVAGQSSGGTRIIGGAQDNGMLMNAGPGTNWKMFNGGDGGYSAIDSTNDNYLYGEYVYLQICRSTNRGSSSTYIDKTGSSPLTDSRSDSSYNTGAPKANFIAPFILDPNDQNRMLAGGLSLWQNVAVRSGTSWTAIKTAVGTNRISAIAVAQGNSAIIWVGHNDGSVYRTANGTDASPTWTLVSGPIGQARIVNRIVIDRDDATKVYVAFGGYNNNNLWLTTNNGTSWTDLNSPARVLPSVPFFGLARHPLKSGWLYVGTEVGLFTSQDGGTTWSTSNDGPANVEIADLAWRDSTTLIAATHGRGMFLATASVMTATTSSVASNRTPATYGQSVTFTATVSPSSATGTVTFYDGATSLGSAVVSSGVATISTTALSAGSHSITAGYGGDSSYSASTSAAIAQTVNPASLNVSATAASKIYGNADPAFAYTVSGLVNSDTAAVMNGSLTRTAGETVGSYTILQGGVSGGANYTIAYTGANLTIIAAVVRETVLNQPAVNFATLASAVSAVPDDGTATLKLLNGNLDENVSITDSVDIKLAGGYDNNLEQQLAEGITRLQGPLIVSKGKVSVSRVSFH